MPWTCDSPLDLLVVAAHPDDAEISCGGTLLAAKAQGLRVGIIDLTNGEPTPNGSPEIRSRETQLATKVLRVDWRENLGLPNRSLEANLSARRLLAEVFRITRPKTIFAHYHEDAHPDHIAANAISDAARFWSKLSKTEMQGDPYHPPRIFYFTSIHLRIGPPPAFVVDISEVIEQKMEAIRCYQSQFTVGKTNEFPSALDDIHSRARYWGWSIGKGYGEPFYSREAIGVSSLKSFLG